MEWAEARKLLETATVRGKPAKLVVDADVMAAAKERIWTGRDLLYWRMPPPNATIAYRGVPLEFSPAVQGVVPVWKEEVVKIGDYVTVKDGSWSMELVNGEWKHDLPADTRRQHEVWRVMATGLKLPTYIPSWLTMGVSDNDVLLTRVGNEGHLLATRAEFLKVVSDMEIVTDRMETRLSRCETDVKTLKGHLSDQFAALASDLDETDNDVEALQRKVRVLEQQINALADRPLRCAKRVGYWRSG